VGLFCFELVVWFGTAEEIRATRIAFSHPTRYLRRACDVLAGYRIAACAIISIEP
jgi:hypothetical protein